MKVQEERNQVEKEIIRIFTSSGELFNLAMEFRKREWNAKVGDDNRVEELVSNNFIIQFRINQGVEGSMI